MLLSLDTMRASNPETKVESRDIDGSRVSFIDVHFVAFSGIYNIMINPLT